MKLITQTNRLSIREIGLSDTDVMLEMHADPDVHRYLGGKTITSRAKIIDAINSLIKQYADYGVGRWAMIDKQTDEFIGWTGLEYVTQEINNHQNFYDLGYRLLKRHWGKGYATESAVASMDYGFNKLKLKEINAMADINNDASNKILSNLGLKLIETFKLEGVEHNWYKLERSDFDIQTKTP